MRTVVEDGGKAYLVENGRVVAAAANKENLLTATSKDCDCSCEGCADGEHCHNGKCEGKEKDSATVEAIQIGDRVEYDGKLGHVISSIQTVYGDLFGVRFDDGNFENAFPEQLAHSEIEDTPQYDNAIDEILNEFEAYQTSSRDTTEEVQAALKSARALNVRAKALMTDPTLPFGEQVKVDQVITATASDLMTLKEDEDLLLSHSDYVRGQPRYVLPEEVFPTQRWAREDASWLEVEANEAEAEVEAIDWDAYLTTEAVKTATHIFADFEDEAFVAGAKLRFNHLASGLLSNEAYPVREAQFEQLVRAALADRPEPEAVPVVELSETDDPDFLWS